MKKVIAVLLSFLLLLSTGCRLNHNLRSLNYSMVSGYFDKGYCAIIEDKNDIYYTTDKGIMKADKITCLPKMIKKGKSFGCLTLYSGRLYFLNFKDQNRCLIESTDFNGKDERTEVDQHIEGLDENQDVLYGFRIDPSTKKTVNIGCVNGFDSSYGLQIVNGYAFYDVDTDDKNIETKWISVNKKSE